MTTEEFMKLYVMGYMHAYTGGDETSGSSAIRQNLGKYDPRAVHEAWTEGALDGAVDKGNDVEMPTSELVFWDQGLLVL